jgi:hypothetical protein
MPDTTFDRATKAPPLIRFENFSAADTLPEGLVKDFDGLIVDRHGVSDDAFMVTEDILGHVLPNKPYKLTMAGLEKTDLPVTNITPVIPETPPHAIVEAHWTRKDDLIAVDANILGGFGSFTLTSEETELDIPEGPSTPEMLAYYGAQLVSVGDVLSLEANDVLPVSITTVGKSYVDNYVMVEGMGDGFYIEVHDRPHLHMPLDEEAAGHMVFGKKLEDGKFALSAFRIPFGYAIITNPYAIHTDASVTGRYMVIYSITPDFSTVIMRSNNGTIVKPVIKPL